ncbi:MAG: cation-translocating P-type ATPase, partial [bacterium]
MTADQVRRELDTDLMRGLTSNGAMERLSQYGPNEIMEKKRKRFLQMFAEEFKNFLIFILLIAAVISILIGEFIDGAFIMTIVLINALIGAVQEARAAKEIRALKKMVVSYAMVIRDGQVLKIPSSELVPGDLIMLETGASVPADIRLIESVNIKIDEASLTGESIPSAKSAQTLTEDLPLADRLNMAFTGTAVVYGRGKGIVTGTGMNTELGKIATMVQSEPEDQAPLEKKFAEFGKWIGLAAIGICITIFVVGMLRGIELFEMFLTSVSLAVAAVPEGLPAVVAVTLALGARRMAKRKAIVRNLAAVETLGSVTTICSDKTGTLTQNKMMVNVVFAGDRAYLITGSGYEPFGKFLLNKQEINPLNSPDLALLLTCGVLCNDAHLLAEGYKIAGDPTEGCLIVTAEKAKIGQDEMSSLYPRISEVPFDSERKRMTTIHKHPQEGFVIFTKGALEGILELCESKYCGGKIQALSDAEKYEILNKNKEFASAGLRVLGFAYKKLTKLPNTIHDNTIENELVFLGFCGMIDPPREETAASIQKCKSARINPIMITGDNKLTALAIAKAIGMATDASQMMDGMELESIENERLSRIIDKIKIFARVSPEHKTKIVKALTERGHIVAMTGDGVNDAPALKQAHIGVAMGIAGTDVSKEASDMVLTDDNFATIVAAIEEGRGIFENIRKFVRYMLSTNMGELLTMFFSILIGFPLPLVPVQVLWINLVTDGLPALALAVEPLEEDLMNRPPRNPKAGVLNSNMVIGMVLIGSLMAAITLFLFWWRLDVTADINKARTVAFSVLALLQMAHVLNCRSDTRSVFELGLFSNKYLNWAIITTILLQLMVIYFPPFQM